MLKSLFIQNFVLIDNLDIQFDKGFSVITGETGAGKSIILGALSLVLGQRADSRSVKQGAEKCIIEAAFDVSGYDLIACFEENDLEFDPKICLFRRELFASGKSRAFVNDSPVSLSIMKELGTRLVDIHSQHQNLLLGDTAFQLRIVDIMAGNHSLLLNYRKTYRAYTASKKQWKELVEKAALIRQEEDYIRFQLEQLDEADLSEGEQETLEQEQELLAHAEEIKGSLYKIAALLNGDEGGVVPLLKNALSQAASLQCYYPQAKDIEERLRSAYIDLSDLATESDARKEDIEYNPERMEWVKKRLNTLYSLEQKHRVATLEELVALQEQYRHQLREIESSDEQIAAAGKQLETIRNTLLAQAKEISTEREKAAGGTGRRLVEMVAQLGMPNARFRVDFTQKEEPDADGMDEVCFVFSANKNSMLQPVAQIASGGEISRLMLCLKAMIAGSVALPSILFDEVDMGISGDIADRMGEIMRELGGQMQVLAITHLPQIASKGRAHYYVYKQDFADHTETHLRRLDDNERVTEVARMLSGATLTEASLANARELLGIKQ